MFFVFYRRRADLVTEVLEHIGQRVFALGTTESERQPIKLAGLNAILWRPDTLPVGDGLSTHLGTLGKLLLTEAGLLA